MPALDTQIIEEEYKEMLRGVELLLEIEKWGNRWMDHRTLAISCEKRKETASGHAGYPVKSSVSSSKYA